MSESRPNRRFRPRLLDIFRGKYTRADLGGDVMAGLTIGLIALPLALALGIASIPRGAETPFPAPALGIFTAVIAGFLISALGGAVSRSADRRRPSSRSSCSSSSGMAMRGS